VGSIDAAKVRELQRAGDVPDNLPVGESAGRPEKESYPGESVMVNFFHRPNTCR